VETDAPYITPVPFRGKRNEPSYVRYTAEKVAEVKGVSFEKIAEATTQNAFRIFRLKDPT
jgi:TatD DNase family protein